MVRTFSMCSIFSLFSLTLAATSRMVSCSCWHWSCCSGPAVTLGSPELVEGWATGTPELVEAWVTETAELVEAWGAVDAAAVLDMAGVTTTVGVGAVVAGVTTTNGAAFVSSVLEMSVLSSSSSSPSLPAITWHVASPLLYKSILCELWYLQMKWRTNLLTRWRSKWYPALVRRIHWWTTGVSRRWFVFPLDTAFRSFTSWGFANPRHEGGTTGDATHAGVQ